MGDFDADEQASGRGFWIPPTEPNQPTGARPGDPDPNPGPSAPSDAASAPTSPDLSRAAVAAAGASVIALLGWIAVGPASLLLDLILAVGIVMVALDQWRGFTLESLLTSLHASSVQLRDLGLATSRPALLVALSPVAVGLLSGVVASLNHTDQDSVCEALNNYDSVNAESTFGASDDEWFEALESLGKTASDYAGEQQDSVRSAGDAAVALTQGTGGPIVTSSEAEADYTIAPIRDFCFASDY